MEIHVDVKIVERIHKLLALAKDGGATEAEADSAMNRAQEIMAKHNLSMAEIESAGQSADAEGGRREKTALDGRVLFEYQQKLMDMVAYVNFCHASVRQKWDDRKGNGRWRPAGYTIIGRQANVIATTTTFDYLNSTINRCAREFVHGDHTQLMSNMARSFKRGMADRLNTRLWNRYKDILAEERRQHEAKQNGNGNTANALVIRLEDIAQKERDANNDMRWNLEPGTTTRRRAEQEATAHIKTAVAEVQMTEAERRRAEKASQRFHKRWERKQQRDAARTNWSAYDQGHRKADDVSLDKQVEKRTTKVLS